MSDCIFCKIIAKQIPAKIAYEDDELLAFHDIAPMAPIHVLIIPKQHYRSLNAIEDKDSELLGKLLIRAQKLAKELGLAEAGYRVAMNTEVQGGQTVFHIHLHLLGGKQLGGGLAG